MANQTVRKASRKKARLRLGISAPAGAGKTMGALLIAYGLAGDWGKIGLLDTEQGSGELYVDTKVPGTSTVIGEYLYWRVDAPYTIPKYLEGMKELEAAGCEVVILDSISHAWSGTGGLLDKVGNIAKRSNTGNSYTAWRDVTPEHNSFVEAMLTSRAHVIATMRSKTEYVLEVNDKGKQVPRKIGLAPVQREGLDYEFTVVLEVDQANHMAGATKDRTAMFDGEFFKLSPETGQRLKEWLERGVDAPAEPAKLDRSPMNRMTSAELDEATRGDTSEYLTPWIIASRDGTYRTFPSADAYKSEWRMRVAAVGKAVKLDAQGKAETLRQMHEANVPTFEKLDEAGYGKVVSEVIQLIAEAIALHVPAREAEDEPVRQLEAAE
jgi:hypothetical protein